MWCCDFIVSIYYICGVVYLHIYKEKLKTIVRELLACTQPHNHTTFNVVWNPYHRVSSRGHRVQIRYSREGCDKNVENDCPPYRFYRESIWTSVFNNTATAQHLIRRRRAAGASYFYFG